MIKLKDLLSEDAKAAAEWIRKKADGSNDKEYGRQYLMWKVGGGRGEEPGPSNSRMAGYIKHNVNRLIKELSYAGNLGVMELVDFYEAASKSQVSILQNLINAKKWDKAWALIQKVTKTKLTGMEEDQYIDPTHADPKVILNPDTDKSFERSKKWGGNVGHPWQGGI